MPSVNRLDPSVRGYDRVIAAHEAACQVDAGGYVDPLSGLFVFTARHHLNRGTCCDSGCRHCPYLEH